MGPEVDRPDFGVVAVQLGFLQPETLARCQTIRNFYRNEGKDVTVGGLLRQMGHLTDRMLVDCSVRLLAVHRPGGAALAPEVPLLGQILIREGLVAQADIYEALRVQDLIREEGLDLPIGKILVSRGSLREEDLARALALQAAKREELQAAPPAIALADFGDLALRLGIITPDALSRCRDLQKAFRERGERAPIGRILYMEGHLPDESIVDSFRRVHVIRPKEDPEAPVRPHVPRLGRILVRKGYVAEPDVYEALAVQDELRAEGLDLPLGEILIRLGRLSRTQLEQALETQDACRRPAPTGTWIAPRILDEDRLFARLAEEFGKIGRLQISDAEELRDLYAQHHIHRRLCEVCQELGYLSEAEIEVLHHLQRRKMAVEPLASAPPVPAQAGLIQAAVRAGLVSQKALASAEECQRALEAKGIKTSLAEILVETRTCRLQDLTRLARRRERTRAMKRAGTLVLHRARAVRSRAVLTLASLLALGIPAALFLAPGEPGANQEDSPRVVVTTPDTQELARNRTDLVAASAPGAAATGKFRNTSVEPLLRGRDGRFEPPSGPGQARLASTGSAPDVARPPLAEGVSRPSPGAAIDPHSGWSGQEDGVRLDVAGESDLPDGEILLVRLFRDPDSTETPLAETRAQVIGGTWRASFGPYAGHLFPGAYRVQVSSGSGNRAEQLSELQVPVGGDENAERAVLFLAEHLTSLLGVVGELSRGVRQSQEVHPDPRLLARTQSIQGEISELQLPPFPRSRRLLLAAVRVFSASGSVPAEKFREAVPGPADLHFLHRTIQIETILAGAGAGPILAAETGRVRDLAEGLSQADSPGPVGAKLAPPLHEGLVGLAVLARRVTEGEKNQPAAILATLYDVEDALLGALGAQGRMDGGRALVVALAWATRTVLAADAEGGDPLAALLQAARRLGVASYQADRLGASSLEARRLLADLRARLGDVAGRSDFGIEDWFAAGGRAWDEALESWRRQLTADLALGSLAGLPIWEERKRAFGELASLVGGERDRCLSALFLGETLPSPDPALDDLFALIERGIESLRLAAPTPGG
ncbi:MAG: hypothetical protein HY720_28275 [Planctomycetes bacterium]|nr:hypothetical protein [Planctomycetota bacterium]